MDADFTTALSLMLIGMLTVFVVLALVVTCGHLLIRLVNRLSPPAEAPNDPKKVAVISATVEAITGGKGRIIKIEKQH